MMETTLTEPFILAAAVSLTIAVAFCTSLFASQSRRFLDQPNERSSHSLATPRTGGLAIIGGWLTGLFILGAFSSDLDFARKAGWLALFAGLALGLGLADDKFNLSPSWKFAGQVLIAAGFAAVFGPFELFPAPVVGDLRLPVFWGVMITVIWVVGFMNVFNFMDGANGLASGAAVVGLVWIAVIAAGAGAGIIFAPAFLLAVAVLGFLPLNIRRGKIFMGDNGSQSVGFLISAIAVAGVNLSDGRMSALIAPVIFMPFIFDVSWTLVSRFIRKQNIFEAHREHLYQLLMRNGASHVEVAVIYMTLIGLCAAAALLMLALPYSLQWLVPSALAASFILGASVVYSRAYRDGLLSTVRAQKPLDEPQIKQKPLRAAE
ncbi:glycosyltransferase family 4 protein [Hyphococcus flavus]|uniref:Glycosyltransferase family 4 protein n=1 Tax=Hyphococcus flavus TaxID=1866326 RepID=A0AAE9ZEL1_9PROT|nr:glycosyltransferase family 4 protein [Hyphococcus flavus]WDI33211.1 glycosyltransferase family 4 protein [Hyphococcus flavus]